MPTHFFSKLSKLWAILLLLLLFLLTFVFSGFVYYQAKNFAVQDFDGQVEDLLQGIRLRMRNHQQILLGTKGLFSASANVSLVAFHRYIESLELEKNYPGIQAIGYSQWLLPAQLDAAVAQVQVEGFSEFSLRPAGVRTHYSMITYIEPFAGRNLAAFGYDMYAEAVRHQAMDKAVINNTPALSGKVKLVQENQGPVQAGTLFYVPIYKHAMPLNSAAERWQALQGFVYSAFRMDDLMEGIIQQRHLDINFKIYDGPVAPDNLLYDSQKSSAHIYPASYHQTREFPSQGQQWTILVDSNAAFESHHKFTTVILVLVLGCLVAILLTAIFYVLASQRQRALSLADNMTASVRIKNHELYLSRERLQLALGSSAMGVWSLSLGDQHVQWDEAMCALFGVTAAELSTTYDNFLAHVHSDDRQRVLAEVNRAIEGKKGYDIEYRIVWPDNSIHYMASRAKIIVEDNLAVSMIGTCWDISERKRLDKVKTQFVSTVSHELRTPLTAIIGALGLVVNGSLGELSSHTCQVLDIAYKNAQRLKLLINDLLDMDKLLAGKLEFHCETQAVKPLIARAVKENKAYADQFNVHYIIEPTELDPHIHVEELRFLQVMANYLSNAAKFSRPGSQVIIRLSLNNGYVRVAVVDQGVGLDAEAQSHIFEKFYQVDSSDSRTKGGTGLGLAISKEIVERMNGRVGFSSVLGAGSTFYLEFPLVI